MLKSKQFFVIYHFFGNKNEKICLKQFLNNKLRFLQFLWLVHIDVLINKKVISENKNEIPGLSDKIENLESMLESFSRKEINEDMIYKVLQTQEFCKELQ